MKITMFIRHFPRKQILRTIAGMLVCATLAAVPFENATAQMLGTDSNRPSSEDNPQGDQGGYRYSTQDMPPPRRYPDQRPCESRWDTDCYVSSQPATVVVVPGNNYRHQQRVVPAIPLEPTPSWSQQQQINRDRANAEWQQRISRPPGQ